MCDRICECVQRVCQAPVAHRHLRRAYVPLCLEFGNWQLPNACGYLSASWAVLLRTLGTAFHEVTMLQAAAFNTSARIEQDNNIDSIAAPDSGRRANKSGGHVAPAACLRRESPGAASGGRFRFTPELRS